MINYSLVVFLLLELVIGGLLLLMEIFICWSLCLWHLALISRWLYFWSWYLYVDLVCGVCIEWVFFHFDYLFFLSSLFYPWGSFGYQDSLPRIILWFDYLCVDRTLSLLHNESGSLIRWPHGREVVYSYYLGPPSD